MLGLFYVTFSKLSMKQTINEDPDDQTEEEQNLKQIYSLRMLRINKSKTSWSWGHDTLGDLLRNVGIFTKIPTFSYHQSICHHNYWFIYGSMKFIINVVCCWMILQTNKHKYFNVRWFRNHSKTLQWIYKMGSNLICVKRQNTNRWATLEPKKWASRWIGRTNLSVIL